MTSKEIVEKYIEFFKSKGHKFIPNVSLIPEGDSTLLFVNAGMFPLVPFLLGETHPLGKRLVNVQRCLRLQDIDEIGDSQHTLAFHMIGNWSLGDYFKKDQLNWIYEFFIDELKLDPSKIFSTVFEGDNDAPKDEDSISVLKNIFAKYGIDAKEGERIISCGKDQNWWQRGDTVGELGGPDSEVFCYLGLDEPKDKSPVKNKSDFMEIGNSVFIQYKKTETGWEEIPQKNVDFGGGLERIAMVMQNKKDIFEIDLFEPIIKKIENLSGKKYKENESETKNMRILADHIRACTMLAMDGVEPSNKEQGYLLRRLLRRMVRAGKNLGINENISVNLVDVVIETLEAFYPDLPGKAENIKNLFKDEEEKFSKTLKNGSVAVERLFLTMHTTNPKVLAGFAFSLYQSLGYPYEMFLNDLEDKGLQVNVFEFNNEVEALISEHQGKSRSGSEQKFKGGLADESEGTIKYHTTAHILQAALKQVLGDHVHQLGANITNERLRYDFPNDSKLNEDQIKQAEDFVNDIVAQKLPVQFVILPKEEALKIGAGHLDLSHYSDKVKVYFIGENIESAVSKEFCGGPHVENTSELKPIKIFKQENIGKGKVRIYAKFAE